MTRVAVLAVFLLTLVGCGQLRLEVQVLDPKVVKILAQDDRVRKELPIEVAKTDAEIDGRFNETANEHYAAYTKTAAEYAQAAAALPKKDEGRDLLEAAAASLDDFPEPMTKLYAEKKAALKATHAALVKAWTAYKDAADEATEIRQKRNALTKEERETSRSDLPR